MMQTNLHCRLNSCYVSRTIFTRAGRHNYADPDYSYTDEEMAAIEAHREYYKNVVDVLREDRKERIRVKEHKQFNDDTNIGIKVTATLHNNVYSDPSTMYMKSVSMWILNNYVMLHSVCCDLCW